MSRREDVDNAIWQDSEFDGLSNEAQLLYLWSFTNPRCGMAGVYKVPRRQLLEGRLDEDDLGRALAELEEERFAFYADGVLWVRSRVKHLRTRTRQIAVSIVSDLKKLDPAHPLLRAFVAEYAGCWVETHENLPGTSTDGSNEPNGRTSTEVPSNLQGKGRGKGKGKGKGKGRRTETSRHARAKVAGKPVTDAERDTAAAVLAAFNEAADSGYTLDAHLTPLVMRIRERPGLSIEVHRQVIAANFANPWWDDRPGVEVIYGNKRAFERAMERAKGPQPIGTKPDFSEYDKTSERFEVAAA